MPPNEKSCEECGNISHSYTKNYEAFESNVILPKRKNKITNPYVRDVFLAYLIKGARRTAPDGFPVIEKWMVATEAPKEMFQWDCRHEVTDSSNAGMSFYCKDENFTPVLNNPHLYVQKLQKYSCVIGMDASPYDNMPPVVQCSQAYTNLAITYYFGKCGLKIIPNVRLGLECTYEILDAIPKNSLVAVGTNGFTYKLANRKIFAEQVKVLTDVLSPSGLLIYGQAYASVFDYPANKGVALYQYDSHTMKRNAKSKNKPGDCHEG